MEVNFLEWREYHNWVVWYDLVHNDAHFVLLIFSELLGFSYDAEHKHTGYKIFKYKKAADYYTFNELPMFFKSLGMAK